MQVTYTKATRTGTITATMRAVSEIAGQLYTEVYGNYAGLNDIADTYARPEVIARRMKQEGFKRVK